MQLGLGVPVTTDLLGSRKGFSQNHLRCGDQHRSDNLTQSRPLVGAHRASRSARYSFSLEYAAFTSRANLIALTRNVQHFRWPNFRAALAGHPAYW